MKQPELQLLLIGIAILSPAKTITRRSTLPQ